DFFIADARQLIVIHVADQVAVEVIQAGGRAVQTADQVHQGRFSGAGRTHDGDVFALLDLDVDARHGMDGLIPHDVSLHQVPGANDDSVAPELLAAFRLIEHRGFRHLAPGSDYGVAVIHFHPHSGPHGANDLIAADH